MPTSAALFLGVQKKRPIQRIAKEMGSAVADTTYLVGAVSRLRKWGYWPHPMARVGFLKRNTKSGWNQEQSLVFQIVCSARHKPLHLRGTRFKQQHLHF